MQAVFNLAFYFHDTRWYLRAGRSHITNDRLDHDAVRQTKDFISQEFGHSGRAGFA